VCCCPVPGPESPPNRPDISDTASLPTEYGNNILTTYGSPLCGKIIQECATEG
jgi:hypothetical protein